MGFFFTDPVNDHVDPVNDPVEDATVELPSVDPETSVDPSESVIENQAQFAGNKIAASETTNPMFLLLHLFLIYLQAVIIIHSTHFTHISIFIHIKKKFA